MNSQNPGQINRLKPLSNISSKTYTRERIFFTLLFSLCLAQSLYSFIWNSDTLIKVNAVLGSLAIVLLSTKIKRQHLPVYVYMGFLLSFFVVSSLFVERTGWRFFLPVLFMVPGFGAAMILLRGYVYSWGVYIVFYALTGYFMSLILRGIPGNYALQYCSHNGISMVMLVACIPLYIVLSLEKKKIDLNPALLTLVVSIWGIGRSGIIAGLVLFFGLFFINYKNAPKYIFQVIGGLIIAFLVMYATNFSLFREAVAHYAQVQTGDSGRLPMWTNYYANLDMSRVIFGVNVETDAWYEGEINDYNYHNSFINLHSQTGLMGLVTFALIIYSLFKFYRTNRVFFILLLALVLRSSTDLFVFFSRFDYIPFFFIFYSLTRDPAFKKESA